ncbi:hypothetical protein K505DRAFT_324252 [Melanomma pulvis-pyrius CBS 109.77]|uniref:Uncharacterized protein n=1 Tax=Melanomma pulvis-pyrius CBS 109.77 TaxID=1314802 RepID=A0A6A6XFQ8_9PLEO|nr:hypothetical protein K505DRAFT_324252 [Melanomma pulvis-pyrius CBS 109.77]
MRELHGAQRAQRVPDVLQLQHVLQDALIPRSVRMQTLQSLRIRPSLESRSVYDDWMLKQLNTYLES